MIGGLTGRLCVVWLENLQIPDGSGKTDFTLSLFVFMITTQIFNSPHSCASWTFYDKFDILTVVSGVLSTLSWW